MPRRLSLVQKDSVNTPFTPAEVQYYICNLLNICHKCCKPLDNVKTVVRDKIDYIVMEEEMFCGHCNASIDYCAQGNCQSEYDKTMFEMEWPKAAELINEWIGK
jgi:hypothetical protein